MRLVFIYGLPATGKLTVARELSRLTDHKVFHNYLVVDLLLSTFEFGSAPFVELREQADEKLSNWAEADRRMAYRRTSAPRCSSQARLTRQESMTGHACKREA